MTFRRHSLPLAHHFADHASVSASASSGMRGAGDSPETSAERAAKPPKSASRTRAESGPDARGKIGSRTDAADAAERRRWFPLGEHALSRVQKEKITRLLVIDDNADVRFAMYEVLSAEGYDVSVAADGLRGLELARLTRPDAVLLDIGMPSLDGYSTARALRHISPLSDTPIIAVTGFYDKAHFERALSAGFDFYFQKPVAIEALLDLLNGRWGREREQHVDSAD